jgi:RNA polymerase sigma-B factor
MTGADNGPPLRLHIMEFRSGVIIEAFGAVDFTTAPLVRAVLRDLAERQVVLGLSGASILDGHSVGMLLTARRQAVQRGGNLRVRVAEGRVRRVLELADAADPLGLHDPGPRWAADEGGQDRTVESLLGARWRQPADDGCREALRQAAIHHARRLAVYLARRYRGRGEPLEDLQQVAFIGLIKAIDGYDPRHSTPFASYAVPTITGELKRYFRDKGWQIRVPRRLQEIRLELGPATEVLWQRLGRSPTVPELAAYLAATDEAVLEAMEMSQVYQPYSLSAPVNGGDGEVLADFLGEPDPDFELIEQRETLRPLMAALPVRQRRILTMRFYGNLSQSEIAARIGISQMHVSRLLSDALSRLRRGFAAD